MCAFYYPDLDNSNLFTFEKKYRMKKVQLLLVLLCFGLQGFSQTFAWAKSVSLTDNTSSIMVTKTQVSSSGNMYMTGTFYGNADFDPGSGTFNLSSSPFNGAIFIMQLDANGNFVWAKKIEGTNSYIIADALAVDNAGNVYVSGEFSDSVDFDPGSAVYNVGVTGPSGAFVLKLNSAGQFVWVRSFESSDFIAPISLKTDANGNCFVGGLYSTDMDMDPGVGVQQSVCSGYYEGFLVKLNTTGNYVWHDVFRSNTTSSVTDIDINATGIYVCGNFGGNIDLDPGTNNMNANSNFGSDDFFTTKLSLNGSFVFGKALGSDGYDEVRSVRSDVSGNVMLYGNFTNTCDFDPGSGTYNLSSTNFSMDPYVMKLNNVGNFLWAKQLSSNDDDEATAMDVDASGNLYLFGRYASTLDADPGAAVVNLNTLGDYDVFMVKLNYSGAYSTSASIGSSLYEEGMSICVKNNQIYGCGVYSETADFDPGSGTYNLTPYSNLSSDVFAFKWSQCTPSTHTINASGCTYTLNGQTYIGNGTYYQVFTNSTGCDSVLLLNLTGSSTVSHVYVNTCNVSSYVFNGQTFTTSGTHQLPYTNAAGCDSSVYLHLNLGTSGSSTTTASACDYYIFNNEFLNSSGTYIDTLSTASGCDSIVTLHLTINYSGYTYIPINACGPVTINGITYTSSSYVTEFYTTVAGCDSIVDYDIIITALPITYSNLSSCTPVTLLGQTYSTSGVYTLNYVTAAGCDSTVNLTLTINTPNTAITQNGATLTSSATAPATYQWIKCNPTSIITGATSQSYTATSNGSYAVIVTLNGCKDTSACKTVSGMSVEDYNLLQAITISPNPVQDFLFVDIHQAQQECKLSIQNATGQCILNLKPGNAQRIPVQVQHLSSGLYFITVENKQGARATFKFTKQ